MKKAVFCIVDSEAQAQRIVDRLLSSNFSNEDISIVFADTQGKFRNLQGKNLTNGRQSQYNTQYNAEEETYLEDETLLGKRRPQRSSFGHEKHTKAPEGATAGALTGGIIGGTIGLLAGIGSIALPGFGALVAAGPLLAALSGSAVGGGVGLLTGALIGMNVPEVEAKLYEGKLRKGGILIAVHTETHQELKAAQNIFKEERAHDICSCMEKSAV